MTVQNSFCFLVVSCIMSNSNGYELSWLSVLCNYNFNERRKASGDSISSIKYLFCHTGVTFLLPCRYIPIHMYKTTYTTIYICDVHFKAPFFFFFLIIYLFYRSKKNLIANCSVYESHSVPFYFIFHNFRTVSMYIWNSIKKLW